MSEDRIDRLEDVVEKLVGKLGTVADGQLQMVIRFDHYLASADKRDLEQVKKDELNRLDRIKTDDRIKKLEIKQPLIDAFMDSFNKVKTTLAAGIILAGIVGGIIGRYT